LPFARSDEEDDQQQRDEDGHGGQTGGDLRQAGSQFRHRSSLPVVGRNTNR
jgi:hypothetical protein